MSLFAVFFVFLLLRLTPAAPAMVTTTFSTIAIGSVDANTTVVCALVLPTPGDGSGGAYELNCTSFPGNAVLPYPSAADVPYVAIAAGEGFLCGLMSPTGGHAYMRWWSFAEELANRRSTPVGKRIYWGESLTTLSACGSHICGLTASGSLSCWEWPEFTIPGSMKFSQICVGAAFVCGLAPDGTLRCLGNDTSVVGLEPAGKFTTVKAGRSHACGVTVAGNFTCWGAGAPHIDDLPSDIRSLALGENRTCVLSGKGKVRCWGPNSAPPADFAAAEFVAIEAAGDVICGFLMDNFSVICWGKKDFRGNHIVYSRAMPGACALASNCPCDILPGSGSLCVDSRYAVCDACNIAISTNNVTIPTKPPPPPEGSSNTVSSVQLVLGIVGAVIGVAVAVAFVACQVKTKYWHRRHDGPATAPQLTAGSSRRLIVELAPARMEGYMAEAKGFGCEEFSLRELKEITNNFFVERRVGGGSFGSVYRATLPDGREVAIKRAERRANHRQRRNETERAFRNELALLSRVNHRNVVRLFGFCDEQGERILVFEFMSKGTLHDQLHGRGAAGDSPVATSWAARLRVALEVARGLEYLHSYAVPQVIHRDIKPSNILLNGEWTAKVSDFGLSIAAGVGAETAPGTAGTLGYMDPEYYRLQELTERSDVYSFGVVLLELITGRRAVEQASPASEDDSESSPMRRSLVEVAGPAVEAGKTWLVADVRAAAPRGREAEAVEMVARVAVQCVRARGRHRPSMKEVVGDLEWAVSLCDDAAPAGGASSRTRSEMEMTSDTSPFDRLSPNATRIGQPID